MPEKPSTVKIFTKENALRGFLIYGIGDTIAALILGEFMLSRMLGMMAIGGSVYALEIPNYFRWIDKKTAKDTKLMASAKRTILAMLYFNPIWIARHLLFVKIFSFNVAAISWGLLYIGLLSFLVNIPISILANYLIQNKIPLRWRFVGSAIFSGIMAIYYACSEALF